MEPSRRVLVVDDSEVDREHIRRLLGPDFSVLEATTAREGLDVCQAMSIDCVLLDYRLPDVDGIALLDELVGRELPVLMLTGQGNETVAVEAMKRGALDYLLKDRLARESLRHSVDNALDKAALQRQVSRQQAELRAYIAELDAQRAQLEHSHRKLAESEERLRVVFEQLPALAWTTDRELVCTSLAGSGSRALGAAGATIGAPIERLFANSKNREAMAAHYKALRDTPDRFEAAIGERIFDGHVEPLRVAGSTDGVIGIALDVTATRSIERQLRHSQKMEAMGKLAGGIAHDFNNILTAIISFAELVKEALHSEEAAYEDIEEVLRAGSRAESLVRQLLAFSRREPVEPRATDVASVAASVAPMLRRLVGEDVTLRLRCSNEPYTAFVDPTGLEQVIVNLVVNARDAMPTGGTITIETHRVTFDETIDSGPTRALAPGEYIQLSVSDTGQGIPRDVQERIFEPFFTTKDPGEGTGLGLSTCYGIVRRAGGQILIYSEPGHGSTFKVYLPSCTGKEGAPEPPDELATGGTETVLVVEDDPQVRAVAARILRRSGYEVLEASDVQGAIKTASDAKRDSVALVLSDVVMPGGTVTDAVDAIGTMHPRAAVLYMSGYTGGALESRGIGDRTAEVVHKPFTASQLARAVREALDRRDAKNDGLA